MADERKHKRHQTQTERDLSGLAARRDRDAATPEFVCEDLTGRFRGEELKRVRRERRSTAARLEHLEDKYDRLVRSVVASRTKIIVAVVGAVGVLAGYLLGGCV
jgi:hypothetical protein